MIYTRSIQPCLDYSCWVWGKCSKGSKFSLLKAAKASSLNSFKKWLNLEHQRHYYLVTRMYKCLHGFALKLLCYMILMASDVNEINTRNTDSLNVCIPKHNIECFRKSFKYAGGKIWNVVPNNNIQKASSVKAFKYAHKKLNFKHSNTHW